MVDLRPGDRVAYTGGALGAYSERRNIVADRLIAFAGCPQFPLSRARP